MHLTHSFMKYIIIWHLTAPFKLCQVKICILEGPEVDSVRIEMYRLSTIISKGKSVPLPARLIQKVRGS